MPHLLSLRHGAAWAPVLGDIIEQISNGPGAAAQALRLSRLEAIEEGAELDVAWTTLLLAEALQQHGTPHDADPLAYEAIVRLWEAREVTGVLIAFSVLGKVWGLLGYERAAMALLQRGIAFAEARDETYYRLGYSLNAMLVRHLISADKPDLDAVETLVDHGAVGDRRRFAVVLAYAAALEAVGERWTMARHYCDEALRISNQYQLGRPEGIALCVMSECEAAAGNMSGAVQLLWEGHTKLQTIGARFDAGRGALQLARIFLARHQHTRALTLLQSVANDAAQNGSVGLELEALRLMERVTSEGADRAGSDEITRWRQNVEVQHHEASADADLRWAALAERLSEIPSWFLEAST